MLDPGSYWVRSFTPIAVCPAARAARAAANKVVSLFQPLRPFASVTRTYEERPLERLRIGSPGSPAGRSPTARCGCCAARATARGTWSCT